MEYAVKCYVCQTLINNVVRKDAIDAWRGTSPLQCLSCAQDRIYSDGIHMATPGPEYLLHDLAQAIGLRRSWYQNNGSYPHYDLTSNKKRTLAIRQGAVRIHKRELVAIMQTAGKSLRLRPAS